MTTVRINDQGQLLLFYIMLVLTTSTLTSAARNLKRNTKAGTVVGNVTRFQGKPLQTYLGIPYAEPPTGVLRFKVPQPKSSWPDVLEAYRFGNSCAQVNNTFIPIPGALSEDCLFINVFVPGEKTNRGDKLPVMIFVHGGGYLIGSANLYFPQKLILIGNVIVVTMNYRLGLLGFFSTGDRSAPGNYGLWDQRLSFKWVQENIDNFGGDPNRVTIFGESAGSSSVSLHALSETNRGLFQRVISESGTPFSPFAMTPAVTMASFKNSFANATGCIEHLLSTSSLVECLQHVIMDDVLVAQEKALGTNLIGPSYDNDFFINTVEDVLIFRNASKHVQEFASSLQYITGCNSHEGGMAFLFFSFLNISDTLEGIPKANSIVYNVLFNTFLPPSVDHDLVRTAISTSYSSWDGQRDPKARAKGWIDAFGDFVFLAGTVSAASAYASFNNDTGTSYMYVFSRDLPDLFRASNTPSWYSGASHGEELKFLFLNFTKDFTTHVFTPADETLSKQMITQWTNFAKSGDPNSPVKVEGVPLWPSYTNLEKQYINLDRKVSVKQDLHPKRVRFWTDLFPKLATKSGNVCDNIAEKGMGCVLQWITLAILTCILLKMMNFL